MRLAEPWHLPNLTAPNRLVRSATYEGLGDARGVPGEALGPLYASLVSGGVGTLITGFCFVSREGRAMQPAQCGMDDEDKVGPWARAVEAARAANPRAALVMQLAHAGRQTLWAAAGCQPVAPSAGRSAYFGERARALSESEITTVIRSFARAAERAQRAGFDGVQLHAAHGYLLHQFLSPATNLRRDRWGKDPAALLREALCAVKEACGDRFPVLLKVSADDGVPGGLTPDLVGDHLASLPAGAVEAVEVSRGTMERAFDIFRGGLPIERVLAHNPLYSHRPRWLQRLWVRFFLPGAKAALPPFSEDYNRDAAREVRRRSSLPLVLVGGIRRSAVAEELLSLGEADAVGLCRPLIREPDLGARFLAGLSVHSKCTNCNACAAMCDSGLATRCYAGGRDDGRPDD